MAYFSNDQKDQGHFFPSALDIKQSIKTANAQQSRSTNNLGLQN